MVKLSQYEIHELERITMQRRNQPIPNSKFCYGEEVIWVSEGVYDHDVADIYDIRNTKALIRNYNSKDKYIWVPLKHIYKKEKAA